jgi:hypothetical protein
MSIECRSIGDEATVCAKKFSNQGTNNSDLLSTLYKEGPPELPSSTRKLVGYLHNRNR